MKTLIIFALVIYSSFAHPKMLTKDVRKALEKIKAVFSEEIKREGIVLNMKIVPAFQTSVASITPYCPHALSISERLINLENFKEQHLLKILCHEIGHIMAGAPFIEHYPFDSTELSHEGEADYFATLKCLKRIYSNDIKNQEYVKLLSSELISKIKMRGCRDAQCIRIVNIAYQTLKILEPDQVFSLEKKSNEVVEATIMMEYHPKAQCRLDTYIAGAVCPVDPYSDLVRYDQSVGVCHRAMEDPIFKLGSRPGCWFSPHDIFSYY